MSKVMSKLFIRWFKRNFSNPQAVILALLLIGGFLAIYLMGKILMPLLVATVLAYLLEWAVSALEKKSVPRLVAVITVFISFCTVSLLIIIGIIPLLGHQIELLFTDLPNMAANIQNKLMELPDKYPDLVTKEQLELVIQQLGGGLTNFGDLLVSFSLASFKNIVTIMIYMILVPLLVFFFLKDKRTILTWLAQWVPTERQLSMKVWQEVDMQIGNYVRGKVVEIFVVGGITYVGFVFFQLNYAVLLAVLVGISVLVPYIGATLVTIPVALVGLIQFGTGDTFLYLMITYLVIQALDGNILVPLLFSETNNLHPVAIIAAVLFFGGIWGFWGVFFAIPLATLVVAVIAALDESKVEQDEKKTPLNSPKEA
jgi:putative permease